MLAAKATSSVPLSTVMAGRRNRGWQEFWLMDRPESCMPANATTGREIAEWWQAYFHEFQDGCRILDIGTGNGIVLRHAAVAATRAGLRFEMTGIDLANIDPQRYLSGFPESFRDVDFHGEVSAEALPFDDHSFDVVVSQYGLEYADLHQVVAEIARVLRPAGELRCLCHSPDSEVVIQNVHDIRQVDFLLIPGGVIESMEGLVRRLAVGRSPKPALRRLADALRRAEEYCGRQPNAAIVREVCQGIADVAKRWQAYFVKDIDHMVSDTRQKLVEHRLRIRDLRAAVITPQRQHLLLEVLQTGAWESAEVDELRVGIQRGKIGIVIRARRAETGVRISRGLTDPGFNASQ